MPFGLRSIGAEPMNANKPLPALILIPLAAFLLGVAAMGWLLANWSSGAQFLGVTQPAAPLAAAPAPTVTVAPEPLIDPVPTPGEPERLVIDPEITRRVNRLEERIGQIDSQSRAAVGNADRAEGLLVAFAARRAMDRGVALGYLEGLLSQRFGDTQPQAVGTIIAASRARITLEQLRNELKELEPQLGGGGPNQSWWAAFRTELGGLVRIRRKDVPSMMPSEAMARAVQSLNAGQVDVALAEVLRLPGREVAREWVQRARAYTAARRALDTIETAALLEPRNAPQPMLRPR
jgi:hypothetical protein